MEYPPLIKIVQKFGGTSVGNIERISHCAALIQKSITKGEFPCVVTSAMSGQTNALLKLSFAFSPSQNSCAQDMVISTGETVAAGLLSLALSQMGVLSKPLSGWQVPILTDSSWGNARIKDVLPQKINTLIKQGIVPIVTGFQGITTNQEITTLGRGGSDTSAVALAASIDAKRCDIYTDVDGVYSADPRFVSSAFKHHTLSFDVALEMTSLGAKVLHPRCVEIAKRYDVCLHVRSSFIDSPGTIITKDTIMENKVVSGIVHIRDIMWIKFDNTSQLPDFLKIIASKDISVDMIQIHENGFCLSILQNDWQQIRSLTPPPSQIHTDLVKISLIGQGLRSHSTILESVFKSFQGFKIIAIDAGETRLSILTLCDQIPAVIQKLHTDLLQ